MIIRFGTNSEKRQLRSTGRRNASPSRPRPLDWKVLDLQAICGKGGPIAWDQASLARQFSVEWKRPPVVLLRELPAIKDDECPAIAIASIDQFISLCRNSCCLRSISAAQVLFEPKRVHRLATAQPEDEPRPANLLVRTGHG